MTNFHIKTEIMEMLKSSMWEWWERFKLRTKMFKLYPISKINFDIKTHRNQPFDTYECIFKQTENNAHVSSLFNIKSCHIHSQVYVQQYFPCIKVYMRFIVMWFVVVLAQQPWPQFRSIQGSSNLSLCLFMVITLKWQHRLQVPSPWSLS